MVFTGPVPKAVKHGRTPSATEWTEVADVPFAGPWPVDLPAKCRRSNWNPQVAQWWAEVRVMPHAALWLPPDWRSALELAYIKQQFWADLDAGDMKATVATEIRRREDNLGLTAQARQKLRIRYVRADQFVGEQDRPASSSGPVAGAGSAAEGGTVTSLNARRAKITA